MDDKSRSPPPERVVAVGIVAEGVLVPHHGARPVLTGLEGPPPQQAQGGGRADGSAPLQVPLLLVHLQGIHVMHERHVHT